MTLSSIKPKILEELMNNEIKSITIDTEEQEKANNSESDYTVFIKQDENLESNYTVF